MDQLEELDNFNFTKDMFETYYIPQGVNFSTSHGNINDFLASLKDEDFTRSEMGQGNKNFTDLEQRSSWTYKDKVELHHYGAVYNRLEYKLVKYKEGDFFNLHKDSQGSHTVLMFCPSEFEGGDLILKKDASFELRIKPSVVKDRFMIVKFSTDFLHEVTPITKGTRYVFKSYIENEDEEEEEIYEDWGGGLDGGGIDSDY